MNEIHEQVERLPGTSYMLKLPEMPPPAGKSASVAISGVTDFNEIKHLLSNRPIHRPARQIIAD